MIDRREAIEKSKTMKRTIFYLFCIGGLTVSSAVAQKRTVSHETGTFVGESSAERPERRVSVSPDGVTVTYEFKHAVVLSDPDVAEHYLWRISGFGHGVVPGEPDVPVRWDSFALPEGCASFTVSVLESACVDVPLRLSPARAPQPEGERVPGGCSRHRSLRRVVSSRGRGDRRSPGVPGTLRGGSGYLSGAIRLEERRCAGLCQDRLSGDFRRGRPTVRSGGENSSRRLFLGQYDAQRECRGGRI